MADPKKPAWVETVPEPEMSLEEAGAAFRSLLNSFRGMVVMGRAVETALTAKSHLAQLNAKNAQAEKAAEALASTRADVEAQITDRRGALTTLDGQVSAARKALADLTAEIAADRKGWESGRATREAARRAELADLDRELLAARARVKEAKDELAAVASKYVAPVET